MMNQIITDPEQVATVINSVIEGDIYQIIPFRRYDPELNKFAKYLRRG